MSETLPAPAGQLPTFTAEDWESHVSTALALKESLENHLWHLAAVCASVTSRYGEESIPKFASEIGYSSRRVYDLSSTYGAWQFRTRSESLSFHHHQVAAKARDPQAVIEKAEDEELSTRQLQRVIDGTPDVEMRRCPKCGGRGRIAVEE
jgi:hypothetical protein